MIIEYLKTCPELLLEIGGVAFGFMMTAMVCVIPIIRIVIPTLTMVKRKSPQLYREIMGKRSESWVERRAGSLKDSGIAWRLIVHLYRGIEIREVVGAKTCRRFVAYVSCLVFCFSVAIALGTSVVAVGFMLAAT